jgi:hypothetical protein
MRTKLPTKNDAQDEFLSRRDLCKRWHCSLETIKRREKAGAIRPLKLGTLVRYRLSSIMKLEQQAES